jgi:cellobiose phosphorylase
MFTMLNPVHHGSQPGAIERYKGKPYVMCADVYATPPHSGRGGWTWYIGEAGWMYRLSVETLLGLQLQVDRAHCTVYTGPSGDIQNPLPLLRNGNA